VRNPQTTLWQLDASSGSARLPTRKNSKGAGYDSSALADFELQTMNYKKERVTTQGKTQAPSGRSKIRKKIRVFCMPARRARAANFPFTTAPWHLRFPLLDARMAELADALDSKSSSERSVGSTPTLGIIKRMRGGGTPPTSEGLV
jgi:hypothetical protein